MCGICGFSPSIGQREDMQLIERMKAYLYHRGPDGEGSYFASECVLGHRRLSIIDLETGHQPMSNEDGTVWIVSNGEIYNYKILWRELEGRGHRFSSNHSDTEVIVHGYEEWGTELFTKLNGIFAIAIWDFRSRLLTLARDHIGVKPLYYAVANEKIVFASEPKAILCHPDIKVNIDTEQVVNYFFFRASVHPGTMFKGIKKLSPGTFIIWDTENKLCKESTYWKPETSIDKELSEKECLEKVDGLLCDSIQGQLISDVPLGVFLSGGVDSSLIASKIIQNGATDVEGFVVSVTDDKKKDEGFWSQKVADHLGIRNNILKVSGSDFLSTLESWSYFNDDPVLDPSALALLLVSSFARQLGKKVMLSGEGGDELFGGYNSYLRFIAFDHIRKIPFALSLLSYFLRMRLIGTFRERDYAGLKKNQWKYMGTGHACSLDIVQKLLLRDINSRELILSVIERHAEKAGMALNQACVFDQRLRLPNDILARTDRASMAVGIEARVPLLDYRLIEFANTIPQTKMLKKLQLKSILKSLALEKIPHDVILRKKMGFDLPLKEWLREDLADILRTYASERKLAFINYSNINKLLSQFFQGNDENVDLIWAYLLLEQWHDKWCGARLPDPNDGKKFVL
ncbi:MAG: asparagine synthase (glutamine-hydrolyzing) [Candidatus Scalindua sp.]